MPETSYTETILNKLETHALRITELEKKIKPLNTWEERFIKLETRMDKFEQEQKAILYKLNETLTMLKQIGGIKNQLLTAFAACGGSLATYLIHMIGH